MIKILVLNVLIISLIYASTEEISSYCSGQIVYNRKTKMFEGQFVADINKIAKDLAAHSLEKKNKYKATMEIFQNKISPKETNSGQNPIIIHGEKPKKRPYKPTPLEEMELNYYQYKYETHEKRSEIYSEIPHSIQHVLKLIQLKPDILYFVLYSYVSDSGINDWCHIALRPYKYINV